jgi:hypothetical protein
MPNFLTQKSRSAAGNQQNLISTDATTQSHGDDLGVAAEAYSVGDAPRNRVQQLRGDVYSVGLDGVYTKDVPLLLAGPWSRVHQFGSLGGGTPDSVETNRKTGIHVLTVNNVAHLCMVYGTDTGNENWTGVRLNTSTLAWSETGDIALAAAGTDMIAEITFEGKLYWITGPTVGLGHRLNCYDPALQTITQINLDDGGTNGFQSSVGNFSMTVMDGKLFVLGLDLFSGNEEWHIAEVAAGVLVRLTTVQAIAAVGAAAIDGKPGFFTDKTYLYCFIWDDNPVAGWNAYRVDDVGAVTQINAVLPTDLAKGAGPPTPTQARWAVTYDPDSVPGSLDIYLWYAENGTEGTPQRLSKWVDGTPGNETEMTAVGTGGDVAHALPSMVTMTGGERLFTVGELDALVGPRSPVLNGQKLRVTGFGDPGVANKNIEFRFSTESEPAEQLCILKGAAEGGIAVRVGNQLTLVDANGTTEYSAIWDTGANGVQPGDRAQVVAYISVP